MSKKAEKESKGSKAPLIVFFGILLVLILMAVTIWFVINSAINIYNETSKNFAFEFQEDGNLISFKSREDNSIADVVARVSSSVVSVVTETHNSSWYGESTSQAAGTGFIVSKDGYIVTNKHVVEKAKSVAVVLDDGTIYEHVNVAGLDPLNDIAVLKVDDVSGLLPMTLGESKTIRIGEEVIAIGNALGYYQNSVTSGIISGTGRSLTATDIIGSSYETLNDMIQTDAAINGGNSGGPLVNAGGQVIGINTAYSSTGDNIGFAIPVANIKGLLKNIEKNGKVERAVLGVRYYNLTAETARQFDLPDSIKTGAYVKASEDVQPVISGGAAEEAGIKEGDVILSVDGVEIGANGTLTTLICEHPVGDTVALEVYRDGGKFTANATLKAYKD